MKKSVNLHVARQSERSVESVYRRILSRRLDIIRSARFIKKLVIAIFLRIYRTLSLGAYKYKVEHYAGPKNLIRKQGHDLRITRPKSCNCKYFVYIYICIQCTSNRKEKKFPISFNNPLKRWFASCHMAVGCVTESPIQDVVQYNGCQFQLRHARQLRNQRAREMGHCYTIRYCSDGVPNNSHCHS